MPFSAYAIYTNTFSEISGTSYDSNFYPSSFSGKNHISIGSVKIPSSLVNRNFNYIEGAFLTNGQALSIDKKYDDGLKNSGNISITISSAKYWSNIEGDRNDCTYDVTITGNKCNLIIKTTF